MNNSLINQCQSNSSISWQNNLKSFVNKMFGVQFKSLTSNQIQKSHQKVKKQKQKNSLTLISSLKLKLTTPINKNINNNNYQIQNQILQNNLLVSNKNLQNKNNKIMSKNINSTSKIQFVSSTKSYLLKQKWKKIMKQSKKFQTKLKSQIYKLLKQQGSLIQDQLWLWFTGNITKINLTFYNLKKEQFYSIIKGKSNIDYKVHKQFSNSCPYINYDQQQKRNRHNQNYQTLSQASSYSPTLYSMQLKNNEKYCANGIQNNLNFQKKKRKVSITKNKIFQFQKNIHNFYDFDQTTSQGSTFSSKTYKSDKWNQNNNNNRQYNHFHKIYQSNLLVPVNYNQKKLPTTNNSMKSSQYFRSQSNYGTNNQLFNNNIVNPLNQPYSKIIRCNLPQFDIRIPHISSEQLLCQLPSIVSHPNLIEIIGSFLVYRPDIFYSLTFYNMIVTFFYYSNSNQLKTFILLNSVALSQFFVLYLSQQHQPVRQIIRQITSQIRKNCPCSVFLKQYNLQHFIQTWFSNFFYSICQNGTQMKQKIIGYLLLNHFSIDSLKQLCQCLINSLKKVITQGIEENIIHCLYQPKNYIDIEIFYAQLFDEKI